MRSRRCLGQAVTLVVPLLAALGFTQPAQSAEKVVNGDFNTNADGWTLIDHYAANWYSTTGSNSSIDTGYDGQPGWFFVNHDAAHTGSSGPETSQLVTGLTPGDTYTVSGYYARHSNNWPDGSFRVLLDNTEYYQAGGAYAVWTPFSFTYVANDTDVLLRFKSQVMGDDAYGIDHISMTPEPAALALLALGACVGLRRRRT